MTIAMLLRNTVLAAEAARHRVIAPGERPAAGPPTGWQPVRHVGPSRRAGEIVGLLGALLLLVATVALRWYGAAGTGGLERPGPSRNAQRLAVDDGDPLAHRGHDRRHARGRGLRAVRGGRGQSPSAAGALGLVSGATALVLAYRVLISPPQPERILDVKLGAVLGLCGAVAIAAGSLEVLAQRTLKPRVGRGRAPAGRRPGE